MSSTIIAASLLAADFRNLEIELAKINSSEAEWIHFDVMDGVFVPNISFGFPILEATRKLTDKYLDVHLMVDRPAGFFEEFKSCGADGLSIHYENNTNIAEDLLRIRALGMKAGLVINPDTDVKRISEYIELTDLILIMAVYPGFGGQSFIESTYERLKEARDIIQGRAIKLEVDGGVNHQNARKLRELGADVLVSGSALFKADDFNEYVTKLKADV